ncbi:MAG: hypothetical protein OEY28_10710, partial [Nitrospira sp.]|nr:hypothetical protein [Nitrospira sp.]
GAEMTKIRGLGFFVLALVVGLLLGGVEAQKAKKAKPDKRELAKAWGPVERILNDTTAEVTEQVKAVESVTSLLDHDTAVKLLGYWEDCDSAWEGAVGLRGPLAKRKQRSQRDPESFKVANAILKAVREMPFPDEALEFSKEIEDFENFGLRQRLAMIDAIAGHAATDEDCFAWLKETAADSSAEADVRLVTTRHLGAFNDNVECFEIIVNNLKDRSWRVRDAAVETIPAFRKMDEEKVILALINALAREKGKLRKTISEALQDITGEKIGTDPDEWSDWFKNKKRKEEGLPPRRGKKGGGTRVKIFGTENFSDRYVFLIDTSTSMTKRITPEQKEELKRSITKGPKDEEDKRRPLDWTKINTKLDLAREEMIRSLEILDPELTTFTIISFSEDMTLFKPELVPTSEANVKAAADWLRALSGRKQTNIFGALDAAYDLSEKLGGVDTSKRKKGKKKKDDGPTTGHRDDGLPDTIFFYTDGWATTGKYTGDEAEAKAMGREKYARDVYGPTMAQMVDEIAERNRIARITLHAIGVGNPQDRFTLRKLAKSCGGEYVAIGAK